MTNKIYWLCIVLLGFASCNSNEETVNQLTTNEVITSGELDLSNYVAIGNSLTSGYTDGALFKAGQENSWTKILSDQFALAGGGQFKIPYMNDNLGGLVLGGNVISENRLYFRYEDKSPVRLSGNPINEIGVPLTGFYNNMGVPGAKSFHLLAAGYGNIAGVPSGKANPYFVRFASSPNASILGDALVQNPTFFTLWIGNNDILSYATSGGLGNPNTGLDPSIYGANDITNPAVFTQVYSTIVAQLTAKGAKGVLANIPDITTIPYFTTIPVNPIPLDQATVDQLNEQLIAPIDGILTAYGQGDRLKLLTVSKNNYLLIKDENLVDFSTEISTALQANGVSQDQAVLMGNLYGQARHAVKTDYILLPTKPLLATSSPVVPYPFNTIGITFPLEDKDVLTGAEVSDVNNAAEQYNATIQGLAVQYNLAFVDTRSLLSKIKNQGVAYGNYTLNSDFVTGGAFSLDGVHPTSRGYALIANEFVKAINLKYKSNLPMINLMKYPTLFPSNLP